MEGRDKSRTRGALAPVLPTATHGRDVLSALATAWFSSHGTPGETHPLTSTWNVSSASLAAPSPATLAAAAGKSLPREAARTLASAPPAARRARAR